MPFKSSLARSAGKLFGVFKERDLSLRGAIQSDRYFQPGYHFSTMKAYSVYSVSARGADYTVQYSADGSNWTTAWTGNFSTNSCGLISGTGGGGDYGAHQYWRYQIGTSTTIHHPNVARIVLVTTDATAINIVTVNADNCTDTGSFNNSILSLPPKYGDS